MSSILVFDLKGPMAHFKKFDTNSSSLSYIAPPRTVISGLIAGVLGYEKDSYYHLFTPEHAHIAVSVMTWPRKMIQTVNYMFVKSKTHFNNSEGPTQIPIEFLFPPLEHKNITYRIFFRHTDQELQNTLKNRLMNQSYVYPPYLGLTEMLGEMSWVGEGTCDKKKSNTGEAISIQSLAPIQRLEERSVQFSTSATHLLYQKERMPRFFDNQRYLQESMTYLIESSGNIIAEPQDSYWEVRYQDKKENILFM